MLAGDGLDRFELHDQVLFNHQVGEEFPEQSAVLVADIDWVLLLDGQTKLAQTMRQSVLIDLFEMAMPKVAVDGETCFPNDIA